MYLMRVPYYYKPGTPDTPPPLQLPGHPTQNLRFSEEAPKG